MSIDVASKKYNKDFAGGGMAYNIAAPVCECWDPCICSQSNLETLLNKTAASFNNYRYMISEFWGEIEHSCDIVFTWTMIN